MFSFFSFLRAPLLYSVLATTNYTLFANKWGVGWMEKRKEKTKTAAEKLNTQTIQRWQQLEKSEKKHHHQTK